MNSTKLLIAVLSVALLLALINLYTFWKKRRKEEAKKRLKYLYFPLHGIIAKKNKYVMPMKEDPDQSFQDFATEYYKTFLELREIYLKNKIYESKKLGKAFSTLIQNHDQVTKMYQDYGESDLPKDLITNHAFIELKHQVDGSGLSELERDMNKVEKIVLAEIAKMTKY